MGRPIYRWRLIKISKNKIKLNKKMGNNLYGAGEAPAENLGNVTAYSAPVTGSYPITFGKGEWVDNSTLQAIVAKDDNDVKIRFVYGVGNTDSGAIYVGNTLASSKVLDVTVDTVDMVTTVTVTYIGSDATVQQATFSITDPESVQKIEEFLQAETITADTTSSGLTVTPTADPETGFNTYEITVNTDGETIDVVNNELATVKYRLDKVPSAEVTENYASQYKLMQVSPDGTTETQVGDTINIDKDRMVRDAHVCTFNKKADGSDYTDADWDSDPRPDLYAELPDGSLEKAPAGYGITRNHTYLHLVINTYDDSGEQGATDDVYLDFTEIMGAAAIEAMNASIINHEERITEIEGSYVKSAEVGTPATGDQFETVTMVLSQDGTDSTVEFDIPTQEYYDGVAANFTQLEENDAMFVQALTWQGLD